MLAASSFCVLLGDLSPKAAPVCVRHGWGLLGRRHPHHGADHHEGGRWAGSRSFACTWRGVLLPATPVWCSAARHAPGGDREQQCSCHNRGSPFSLLPQALKWHLSPLTIVSWLSVYLQVAYLNDVYEVLLPQYPQQIFTQIAEASGRHLGPAAPPGRVAPQGRAAAAGFSVLFSVALGPLRPGCRLPRIFLRCPCCFCLVPLLFVRTDAKGFRCVRRWVKPTARSSASD